jgi:hypothetical protein
MGVSFLKKRRFSPFERRFIPIFCYEISATALAERFCVARGTRDTKIQVIEVSVSSLYYLSSVVALSRHVSHGNTFVTSADSNAAYKWQTTKPAYNRKIAINTLQQMLSNLQYLILLIYFSFRYHLENN